MLADADRKFKRHGKVNVEKEMAALAQLRFEHSAYEDGQWASPSPFLSSHIRASTQGG